MLSVVISFFLRACIDDIPIVTDNTWEEVCFRKFNILNKAQIKITESKFVMCAIGEDYLEKKLVHSLG